MKTWAKELLQRSDWVILDTETTGLGNFDQIVQIGVLSPSGEVLLDTLTKPSIPIPDEATRIHGITNQMVANAPDFSQIWPKLVELTQDKVVVVYNATYDWRMVKQSIAAALDIDHFTFDGDEKVGGMMLTVGKDWACAMSRYAEFWGEWSSYHQSYTWQKLTNACRQQGLKIEDAHSAIGDCRMTLALIKAVSNA